MSSSLSAQILNPLHLFGGDFFLTFFGSKIDQTNAFILTISRNRPEPKSVVSKVMKFEDVKFSIHINDRLPILDWERKV